jgi:hypothetical protein
MKQGFASRARRVFEKPATAAAKKLVAWDKEALGFTWKCTHDVWNDVVIVNDIPQQESDKRRKDYVAKAALRVEETIADNYGKWACAKLVLAFANWNKVAEYFVEEGILAVAEIMDERN